VREAACTVPAINSAVLMRDGATLAASLTPALSRREREKAMFRLVSPWGSPWPG